MILEKKFPVTGANEQIDAARFYSEHYKYLMKYLPRCHRHLLSDGDLLQLYMALNPIPDTEAIQVSEEQVRPE